MNRKPKKDRPKARNMSGGHNKRATGICSLCGRKRAEPLRGEEAATHRELMQLVWGEERGGLMAYAFCVSTVLMTEHPGPAMCACDIRAWNRACDEYKRKGPETCWTWLGVTVDTLKRAEAMRLCSLSKERELSSEERARLEQLAQWMTTS